MSNPRTYLSVQFLMYQYQVLPKTRPHSRCSRMDWGICSCIHLCLHVGVLGVCVPESICVKCGPFAEHDIINCPLCLYDIRLVCWCKNSCYLVILENRKSVQNNTLNCCLDCVRVCRQSYVCILLLYLLA